MKIAAILPCYNVAEQVLPLISKFGNEVEHIIIVDDGCPQKSGEKVKAECLDKRVTVLFHKQNKGVGAAVKNGYNFARTLNCDILVKIDGDGKMDPSRIPELVAPILNGEADYVKGNRFFQPEELRSMPIKRLATNAAQSFLSKLSTGYWKIFDPANGYTAIHAKIIARLPVDKISDGYFFEMDLLFRLSTLRAVVIDVPMKAFHGEDAKTIEVRENAFHYIGKSLKNTWRRIAYNYFLRGFSIASFELVIGKLLLIFGIIVGLCISLENDPTDAPATAGLVMLCALPTIVGLQMLLSFLNYDINQQPSRPLHPSLSDRFDIDYTLDYEQKD